MTLPMASSRSSVGLGHPSSSSLSSSPGRIGLKSPSGSLSRSTSALLTPIDLAQSHYQSAAHHFLQRCPVLALVELEQTRRLVIDHQADDPLAWSSVCEKATILWITLLISLRKLQTTSKGQAELNDGYSETTKELLSHNDSSQFLSRLLSAVCQIYAKGQQFDDAPTAGSSSSRRPAETTILPPPETEAGHRQRAVLALLPEKVTASVIMALLGVEDGPRSSAGDAASVPLTRSLAEELLNSQVKALGDSQYDATAVMASYSRTLELYAIHVLGVRCGEWAYADQIVRTSLLHDEPRATLLASLSRAQQHIDSRPQRRASALQAQQARYEEEKSKRAKADRQRAASGADQRDADESNALKTKSTGQKGGQAGYTSNGNLTQNRDKSPKPQSLPQATSSTSSAASSPRPSPPLASFDGNRSQSSRSISRDRERAEKEDASAGSSSLSSSAKRQTLLAKSSSFWSSSGLVATLRSLKLSNLRSSSLISILAPLVILLFTLRRLRVGKSRIAAAGVPVASASAAASSGSSSVSKNVNRGGGVKRGGDNLFVVALGKVWNTVKMGTQVSYL